MKAGEYKTAWFCAECKEELTSTQVYGSNGTCPKCGFMSGYLIVNTFNKAYRYVIVESGKWWKRNKVEREFKSNDPTT